MNPRNMFKQAVIEQATRRARGISHSEAVRQVEQSFRFYPAQEEEVFEHCGNADCLCGNQTKTQYSPEAYGATVGDMSYGGDEYGERQMWPISTNDGTIAATVHITSF